MRCPRCGNENPGTNRFCGSCGTSLLGAGGPARPAGGQSGANPPATAPQNPGSAPAAPAETRAATQVPLRTPVVAPPRFAHPPAPPRPVASQPPPSEEVPAISGPSFLGLGAGPASSPSRNERGLNLRSDAHHADAHHEGTSRNLAYLLEDDEEEPRSGAWKFALIVVALVLAASFGYLRWKNQGLSSLFPSGQKPASTQTAAPADGTAPDANAGSNSGQPSATTAQPAAGGADAAPIVPAPASPAATTTPSGAPPAAGSTAPTQAPAGAAPVSGSASAESPAASAPANPPAAVTPVPDKTAVPAATPAAKPAKSAPPKNTAKAAETDSGESDSSDDSDDAAPAKPVKATPARPVDPVAQAEKYIYGKGGVSQDCDRGLKMLRPAADKGNTGAMISMGALYSTGTCTSRDLPTAYKWLATALRKEPDNQSLQADLEHLWGQMTQPERKLAIQLSQ